MPRMSVATIRDPEFINITSVSPRISECEIKVLYTGENRNHSVISKEVATEMAKTLPGTPIVGYYIESQDDFGDHGEQIIIDAEGVKFKKLTTPYGFVSPTSPIWFKEFEDTDEFGNKTIREYLMCKGYLWTEQFEEAKKVINEGRPHSMELDSDTLQGYWSQDMNRGLELFIINDAIFSQLCILGNKVEPCFEGSTITAPEVSSRFQLDEKLPQTLSSMMAELREFTLLQNKGGNSMTVEQNPAAVETSVVEENFTETPVVEEQAVTEEQNTATEEFTQESTEEAAPAQPAEEFKKEDEAKEDDKEEESKDESEDEEKEDDDKEEDKKSKANNTLNTESSEYTKLAVEFTRLQNEYNELVSKYTALENENQALVQFKNEVEDQKKTELINSFYMLSDEDKKEVIENKTKYSLDDIEAKLSIICVRKKVNFNQEENKEVNTVTEELPPVTFTLDAAESDNIPAWLKAVDSYKDSKEF